MKQLTLLLLVALAGAGVQAGAYTSYTAASGTANPYAYNLRGSADDSNLSVTYALNAAAESVAINILDADGQTRKSVTGTANAGANEVIVSLSGLTAGSYTWEVAVNQAARTNVQYFGDIKFNHPQGVETVRDTESPYYGLILATEGRAPGSSHYTYSRGGQGVYAFYPDMSGVENTAAGSGVYAFRGGLSANDFVTAKATLGFAANGMVPRKIRVSEDGRVFISTQNIYACPVYTVASLADLLGNVDFTPLYDATISSSDFGWYNASNNLVGCPNHGLAVVGKGSDLTVYALGGLKSLMASYTQSASRTFKYAVGAAATFGSNNAELVSNLSGRFLTQPEGANLNIDSHGYLWMSQYRGSPSATDPSIVCIDPTITESGNEESVLFKDTSYKCGGGGFRFNPENTQVVFSSSTTTFSLCDLTYTDGVPSLSEASRVAHGMSTNVTDYAWDLAGNIYAVGNNGELLRGFALPHDARTVATPCAAAYGFTIEEEQPSNEPLIVTSVTAGTANPFAYDLYSNFVADHPTYHYSYMELHYTLNAPAKAATARFFKDGELVHEVEMAETELSAGDHLFCIDLAGWPVGTYTWSLDVHAPERTTVNTFGNHKFNHPQGVEVIRDVTSPYFGYLMVSEGRALSDKQNTTAYAASTAANGSGPGLYIFNPVLSGVKNPATGKYGFTGGMTVSRAINTSTTAGAQARKIRMTKDGRIFVSTQNSSCNPLYEVPSLESLLSEAVTVSDDDLEFTPVLDGTYQSSNCTWTNTDGDLLCGALIGFDVKGTGDDLSIVMTSGNSTLVSATNTTGTLTGEISLGNNANWSAPSSGIEALTGKYGITNTSINVAYDNRGGIWWAQHRATPSSTQPSLIYIAADGTEKYKDITTVIGGGGIRLNDDCTRMVLAGSGKFTIFDLSYSDSNVPTLTEEITVTHTQGTNINDFAWDDANNLYAVSNSNEILVAYSLPVAENTVTTTNATGNQGFTITVMTGVEDAVKDAATKAKWSVYTTQGQINITGEAKNPEVYDLQGKRISRGKTTVKVRKGVYIVRCADGAARKVIVK
ncbi:MAG: hypothetical protein LUC85_07680 [Bacteroidales bacterium]|nr:hypothetical protein [Bacteroidales bacterium]